MVGVSKQELRDCDDAIILLLNERVRALHPCSAIPSAKYPALEGFDAVQPTFRACSERDLPAHGLASRASIRESVETVTSSRQNRSKKHHA